MLRAIKNCIHLANAFLACLFYRFPGKKMVVVGITGTDGKTTTTHLLYSILKEAGKKVSLVSSIEAIIADTKTDTGLHVTTPSPWTLQKFMRKALNKGSEYIILEVTSHGLDQSRVFGTFIDIGLVTNISHEHLDYHNSLKNYKRAKAKIFKGVEFSVINKDDSNYNYLKKQASGKAITFSLEKDADYTLSDFDLKPQILGKYNLYNCLAASVVAKILEVDRHFISRGVARFKGVKGRMEEVKTKKNFRIFIDFAHKINALEQALKTTKKLTKGKLIVIFGSAGLRDRLKRPIMGEVAAKFADYIVLTAEDPRTEDVRDIINEIANGCIKKGIREADKRDKKLKNLLKGKKYFWRIPDRQEAINFAINTIAKKGDVVVTCGKGHEKSMCYGKIEHPWDEFEAIKKALNLNFKK